MAIEYNKHQWSIGEAITQEKMNNIETGIENAYSAIDQRYTKSEIDNQRQTINIAIQNAQSTANNAQSDATTARQETQDGKDAMAQIRGAMQYNASTDSYTYPSLNQRFQSIDQRITNAADEGGTAYREVVEARGVLSFGDGNNAVATKLKQKLDNMEGQIGVNRTNIATSIDAYTNAKGGFNSLQDRLNAIDGDTTNAAVFATKSLASHVSDVESILDNAKVSSANNKTYGSLDARLEADETTLKAVNTEVSNAHRTTNDTLDARFDSIDGGAAPSRTLPNVITEIEAAHRNGVANDTLNQRFNAIDSSIATLGSGFDSTNTVAKAINDLKTADTALGGRIDDVNTTIGTDSTANTIKGRIKALETEIDNANGNGTLDDRFDAVESRLDAVDDGTNTMINSINDKIDTIESTANAAAVASVVNASIDNLDTRLDAIDGGNTLTGETLASRMSTAESDIDTLEAALNNTDGIVDRIEALESNIDTNETGLLDRMTAAEGRLTDAESAIGNAATAASVSTLAGQVAELVNKDTIVVNKPNGGSNFTNNVPNISNPLTTADYLIQADDDKYYYWRYINNNWELISGAGEGGSGTSSGLIVDQLPSAADADENTDYFVYDEETQTYLHYRFTTINNVKQAVLIGPDLSNLKQYNIEKIIDGEKTYLRLYEFNYGDGNAINLDNTAVFSWVSETSYDIDSLVLYQGYFYKCLVANNDAEWNANKWERISDIRAVTTIELPQGGGGGSSTGAITRFIRLAPTSITTIQNNDPIYIHFFYSCVDPNEGSFTGHYTLTDKNGVQLLSESINSGSGTDSVTAWPQDRDEGKIYNDGYGSIDVSPYCVLGRNTFNLVITTETNETFTRTWIVDVKQLNIESTAPESIITEVGQTVNLPYTPYGAMQKTLIVKIDGVQVKTESLGSGVTGTEQNCIIPAQSVAGAHTIELRLSASINGDTKTSDPIIRDYIWYDSEDSNAIIISSPYRNEQIKTVQYSEIAIPYTIYKSNTNNFTVEYYYEYDPEKENTPFDTITLTNTNNGILRYIPVEASLEDSQQSTSDNKVYIPNHLTIKVEDTILTFDFIATPMPIDIAPVAGEVIDFNPATLNNNSINRLPSYLSVSDNFNWSTNWEGENQDSGGGYRTDEDGKCFVIKAGTYAEIDYKMFKQRNVNTGDGTTSTTSSVFDTGAEMKLIFKVTNVRDASTVWFTNMGNFINTQDEDAKKVGIQLKAHEGWLKTDKASNIADTEVKLPEGYVAWSKTSAYAVGDVVVYKAIIYQCIKAISQPEQGENSWDKKAWISLGQLETEISATNSYLYFPYSEDDKIELDININKQGNNQNFIMSYEDGVPSKAYPYNYSSGGDILYHVLNNESIIHIGSPDCDVHIYRLRIYNKSLSTDEILKNFIADGETMDERIKRYNRNSIYYNPELNDNNGGYTPYKTGSATLDPYRLAERIPDVKVLMLDTPRFTTGKKDFVKGTTLRCIQASGGKVYPANLEKDNWYFFNGYHAGQGTTSDNYGQSARNVDFLFECDTEGHAPTKIGNLATTDFPDPNYVSAVAIGQDASVYDEREETWSVAPGVTPDRCINWMDNTCKVSLTHIRDGQVVSEDTSIPNNYFNLKVNVASSENVNNALFQKRYNDFLPYTSPAKRRDSRIKNDMEFVPAVLFIRERGFDLNGNVVERKEFNDDKWHFYALGNLGDSKKTDYTRAYDPTDMYEFTIEISDNNTTNSQFQSGVFLTDPNDPSTATVETQVMADNPNIDQDPMKYIYPITSEQWNASREPTEQELADSLAARGGNTKKTDVCKAPNDRVYTNYRHYTLSTEPFDGDHSFEFRYACCGAFRDGDIINPYDENDPEYAAIVAQGEVNRAVWEAFYEWTVTSTEQQFRDEAALWFVPSAVEFFYAFTHYYTMMDNRAKNTFWHFAKTGTWRKIPIGRAVPALYHIYEESDGTENGHKPVEGTFDNTKQYYTQYAFDIWVYDTDTACGIDNNGELSFPYGKEDRDYRTSDAASGWAFNGSGSIFWRRLSDPSSEGGFADEISALMRQEDDNCFATAQHLINQFDEFQNCFPEEIWRLDIERKYIRTFTGASIDGSITDNKQNIRFLRAMMQGRKKYQRRQWVRNQAVYFGSKYGLSNVRTAEHTIEFNIYTPSSDGVTELAVPVDQSQLVIKPYQDMYIDVAVGNSTTNLRTQDFKRAKAGERVVVDCRSGGSAQETRVYIFGGEHIAALENLAPMYTYSGSFGQGKHLKVLDLGSDNPNYNNPRFTSISINENMPLLERFSVKNCNRLAQSIDLHLSNNLREFEADGSLITGVSLPNYSNIEVLHLPTTVTSVVLNFARALNDFYIKNKTTGEIDYSNLITLNINDSDYSENINWINIASQTLNKNINWLYLQNLQTTSIINISALDIFDAKKKALEVNYGDDGELIKHIVLSGMLKITGEWSTVERDYYGKPNGIWPNLIFDTSKGREVTRYKVIYKYDSTTFNGAEIATIYITPEQGATTITIPEINNKTNYPDITINNKPSTKEKYYVFGELNQINRYIAYSGWRLEGTSQVLTSSTAVIPITQNMATTIVVETVFNAFDQSYPIYWYLNHTDSQPVYIAKNSENQEIKINWGGTYNGYVPTVQDIKSAGFNTYQYSIREGYFGYKIFKGWEKPPIDLTLNDNETAYKIYATWDTAGMDENGLAITTGSNSIPIDSILAQETLTIPKLALLSFSKDLRSNTTNLDINDRLKVTMGYDGPDNGQLIISDSSPYIRSEIIDDTPIYNTNIIPFNSNNDAFTLALDYKFDTNYLVKPNNTAIEAVLAGCYENNSEAIYGFRLYFDLQDNCVRIGFGDTLSSTNKTRQSKILANAQVAQYRNIIVLRHPKNSETLYVYSGTYYYNNNNSGSMIIINNITDVNYESALTWSNVKTNAPLIIGGMVSGTSPLNTTNAFGTIYWAKYWNQDLGADECKHLASWPHEPAEFAVEDYQENPIPVLSRIEGVSFPHIILTSMTTSSYIGPVLTTAGQVENSTVNGSIINWNGSKQQEFSNQRIFYGLPIQLQSMLIKTPLILSQSEYQSGIRAITTNSASTDDYIYYPTYRELVNSNVTVTAYNAEAQRNQAWVQDGNVTMYSYNGTTFAKSEPIRYNYMNLRFPYKAIGTKITLFYIPQSDQNPFTGNVYDTINNSQGITLSSGDIFTEQNGNAAYMYISADEMESGIPIMGLIDDIKFKCRQGAWIRSENWWTRSVKQEQVSSNYNQFVYVHAASGNVIGQDRLNPPQLENYNNLSTRGLDKTAPGANICYSFGV